MINENGDTMVECPYDSTHTISDRCLGKHLIRCRENHMIHKKVACKYDKTHLVPRPELPYHLSVCPSRYLLDRELQLKAAAAADGVLCGDVKGPQVPTHDDDDDDDEEEWGSEPAPIRPVALFNKEEKNDEESETPRTIPGANYAQKFSRHVAASGEETCRKFPIAPSKVAQISEVSKKPVQPGSSSQVYQYSLTQAYSNPGFGRGRGTNPKQALQTVGVPRSYLPDPDISASADISGLGNMPQPLRIERNPNGHREPHAQTSEMNHLRGHPQPHAQTSEMNHSRGHTQPRGQTSEVNHSHLVPRLDNSSPLKQQQKVLYNQLEEEALLHGYRASFEQFENSDVENHEPETFLTAEQLINMPRYQAQTNMPLFPKGRGCFQGYEQLRRPTRSSHAQGSTNYSNLPDATRIEGHSEDVRSALSEQNDIDKDSNFTDADTTSNSDDLHRAEHKLRKKLKQLKVLEKKSAAGIQLNEEEKCKIQKKDEIMSLIESISKLL